MFHTGQIVRITAPGLLFSSEFLAHAMSDLASVSVGLANLSSSDDNGEIKPPKAKANTRRGGSSEGLPAVSQEWPQLPIEAMILWKIGSADLSGKTLRGMVQVFRGMFPSGIGMHLYPSPEGDVMIECRLQENRQYPDSEPAVLMSRYGLAEQDWTVVGFIGHIASAEIEAPDLDFMGDGDNVVRAKVSRQIPRFLRQVASHGFTSLPQQPSMTIVPLAVYRYLNATTTDWTKAKEGGVPAE